jgi:ectoine hydroxylase-related dioxygenase (phytanoyl-CoA dioxygenase family)
MAATPDGNDDGFRIVDAVLASSETVDLLQTLDASLLTRSRAGARHLMRHSAVADVANDPRVLAIACGFLGPSAVPYRATLFDKSSARNWLVPWHQDTALPLQERRDVPGWGPWSVKSGITYAHAPAAALVRVIALRLHFDDSRADNGPLRVLPGTHEVGVVSEADTERFVRGDSAS